MKMMLRGTAKLLFGAQRVTFSRYRFPQRANNLDRLAAPKVDGRGAIIFLEGVMKRILAALAVITWTLGFASASSAAVSVTETVTGTAGDWVHEFTVDNGLPSGFAIYFFGVKMDQRNIVGSPAETDPNAHLTWNNAGYGGSSTVYNNNWIDFGLDLIPSGSSLSGFKVRDTNTVAQTGIQWFAFGYLNGGNYQGDDAFNRGFNPGFEGVVGVTGGIPEPATWALMIGGFGLAGATLRRRKAAIA